MAITTTEDLINNLEKDSDFKKLDKILKQENAKKDFNIFKVLKLQEHEIRHSNFLAWLLDPANNHGLKSEFLKSFLKEFNIDWSAIKDVEVKTEVSTNEGRRIDILIKSNNFVCVIENKYGSAEHDGQCEHYKTFVNEKDEFKNKDRYFIYLDIFDYLLETENEENDSLNGYKIYTYEKDVLQNLEKVEKELTVDKNAIEYKIIEQYKKILKEKYMTKGELDKNKLCSILYKNHQEVIDYIINSHTRGYAINLAIEELISEDFMQYEVLSTSKDIISFIPKQFRENILLKKVDHKELKIPCFVYFEFKYVSKSIRFQLVLGPSTDKVLRKDLWKILELNKKYTEKWTQYPIARLDHKKIEDLSIAEIKDEVRKLLSNIDEKIKAKIAAISKFQ